MPIQFWNTLSRKLETFEPRPGQPVSLYTCGPTVYAHAHIGNFRAYIFEDLLQRHLELRGHAVRRVMNLTDVDDKTIRGANAAGIPLAEYTKPFKQAFFEDLKTLRIKEADFYPAATDPENISQMIDMIRKLMESGHAYQAEDRSVYFRLSTFPRYGRLAHIDPEDLRPSGRIQNDEYEKESIGDFALWKAWDEKDGGVAWDSPWGKGRPGWHIECSAMATRLLGPEIDIHCGGVDNIFPHHEAEIAQSECCTGKTFVRYWLHCSHLMVDGQKMAKSLGNFYTLRDLLARGYSGREVRYALLCVDYRLPLNFKLEGLEGARSALQRLDAWVERLQSVAASGKQGEESQPEWMPGGAFEEALDRDLNISEALAVVFQTVRETNKAYDAGILSANTAKELLAWWDRVNSVLQVQPEAAEIPPEVARLLEARAAARAAKNWALSDQLRDEILAAGWEVKDSRDGQKVTKAG
jgi:cysteinyl-tRNA synthetase